MLSSVMALHCPDSMSAVADFFNKMTPSKLERLGDIYGPGVVFHDPIHDALGLSQLREVFANRLGELDGHGVSNLRVLRHIPVPNTFSGNSCSPASTGGQRSLELIPIGKGL